MTTIVRVMMLCLVIVCAGGCSADWCKDDAPPVVATPKAVNQDTLAVCQSLTPIVMVLMDKHDEYVVSDTAMTAPEKNRALNESLLVRQSFCLRCVELYPIYETLIRCLDRLDAYVEYEISDASRRMTLRQSHDVRATVNRLIGSGVYVVPGRRSTYSGGSECGGARSVEERSLSPCDGGFDPNTRSLPPPPPPPRSSDQLPAPPTPPPSATQLQGTQSR